MWRYDDEGDDPQTRLLKTQLSRNNSFETLGPIGVVLGLFLAIHVALLFAGFETTKIPALIGAAAVVGLWVWLKRRRSVENMRKVSKLRGQLSELEEQEFKLRYEEAKLSGQLDRWKETNDHHNN